MEWTQNGMAVQSVHYVNFRFSHWISIPKFIPYLCITFEDMKLTRFNVDCHKLVRVLDFTVPVVQQCRHWADNAIDNSKCFCNINLDIS